MERLSWHGTSERMGGDIIPKIVTVTQVKSRDKIVEKPGGILTVEK